MLVIICTVINESVMLIIICAVIIKAIMLSFATLKGLKVYTIAAKVSKALYSSSLLLVHETPGKQLEWFSLECPTA